MIPRGVYYYYIFFTQVLSSQGEKKLCYAKKNVKLEWSLLLLLLHKTVVE